MEDEFTRRIDDKISELEKDAKSYLINRNMTDCSYARGEINALQYSKFIYLALKTRDTTNTITS